MAFPDKVYPTACGSEALDTYLISLKTLIAWKAESLDEWVRWTKEECVACPRCDELFPLLLLAETDL